MCHVSRLGLKRDYYVENWSPLEVIKPKQLTSNGDRDHQAQKQDAYSIRNKLLFSDEYIAGNL